MGLVYLPKANVGEASSQGIDLTFDFNKQINNDWLISGRANFTYAKSKFKVFEEPNYETTPWLSRIGYPINQSWGYVAERLFVDDEEVLNSPDQGADAKGGDIKYKDINDDGLINQLDKVPIGFPTIPEIVYGLVFQPVIKRLICPAFFKVWQGNPFGSTRLQQHLLSVQTVLLINC